MKPTRRQTLQAGAALAALRCGRAPRFELDDPSSSRAAPSQDPLLPRRDTEMASSYPTTPLFLTANAPSISSNATAGVNAIALRNPNGLPMEILAISWQISGTFGTNLTFPYNAYGGIIGCKLDLGQIQITNGFVPVWLMGRSEQLPYEAILTTGRDTDSNYVRTMQYLWRLPRPLFVPAGGLLMPTFSHRGLMNQSLSVNIGYTCRSLPANCRPSVLNIPYAAAWVSKNFNANQVTTFDLDQSTETDLVNPHDEVLNLQRLTGRAISSQNNNIFNTTEGGSVLTDQALGVRMVDSQGRPIIYTSTNNGFTNFRSAFAAMTRSWEMDNEAAMEPRSYFNAFTKYTSLGTPAFPFTVQSQIGLVGWRELKGS